MHAPYKLSCINAFLSALQRCVGVFNFCADHNATMKVRARLGDGEITRFTPYKEVRLISRSLAQLSVNKLELGEKPHQPSADKFYVQLCTNFRQQVSCITIPLF